MIGDPINSVQQGLGALLATLRSDPHSLETAWISIITFSSKAHQLVPLTELTELTCPQLSLRPGTCLGKALFLLRNCIETEVKRTTPSQRGDYRPLVFLLTDGQSTDDWQDAERAIRELSSPRIANFYVIGCGDDVDYGLLHDASDAMFAIADMTPEIMRKLFIWLTASVRTASIGATSEESYSGIDLSKKPEEVTQLIKTPHPRYTGLPLQVFLKANCRTHNLPYLMRFRLDAASESYNPVLAHKLEVTHQLHSSLEAPSICSSQLNGFPECPYCKTRQILFCGCGAITCLPVDSNHQIECAKCSSTGPVEHLTDNFGINTSAG